MRSDGSLSDASASKEEIANLATFLLSDLCPYQTGRLRHDGRRRMARRSRRVFRLPQGPAGGLPGRARRDEAEEVGGTTLPRRSAKSLPEGRSLALWRAADLERRAQDEGTRESDSDGATAPAGP